MKREFAKREYVIAKINSTENTAKLKAAKTIARKTENALTEHVIAVKGGKALIAVKEMWFME